MSVEKEELKITNKAILLTIISSLIVSWLWSYNSDTWNGTMWVRSSSWWPEWPQLGGGYYIAFGTGILICLFAALINRLKPGALNRLEVAMMTIAAPMGSLFYQYYTTQFVHWALGAAGVATLDPSIQARSWQYLPYALGGYLPDSTAWHFLLTTVPRIINWGVIMPMTVANILWIVIQFWFMLFVSMLLRYMWINVEALPHPVGTMFANFVDFTQPVVVNASVQSSQQGVAKPKSLLSNKLFWIPFILAFIHAFLAQGISSFSVLLTQNPNLRFPSWMQASGAQSTLIEPDWDINAILQMPTLWVPLFISLWPLDIAWCTLLPQTVAIGVLVSFIAIDVIWPLISSGAGIYPANAPAAAPDILYNARFSMLSGESLLVIYWGMLLGLAIVPIWMHRREIAPIFKSLYSKADPSFDPDKPISYRLVWLMVILFGVLWLITGYLWWYMPLDRLTVFAILMTLTYIGIWRLIAESGGYYGLAEGRYSYLTHLLGAYVSSSGLVFPWGAIATPSVFMVSAAFNFSPRWYTGENWGIWYHGWWSISGFKISDLTKSKPRAGFWALIIGSLISVVVMALVVWVTYIFHKIPYGGGVWDGQANWVAGAAVSDAYDWASTGQTWNQQIFSNPGLFYVQLLIGFIIVAALLLLQPRMGLLQRLSVGGVVMGVIYGPYLFLPMLIGLIIRSVSLRMGGVELYEGKLRPIMLGILGGYFVSYAIVGAVANYNYTMLGWVFHT